jgi:hypothetical protein
MVVLMAWRGWRLEDWRCCSMMIVIGMVCTGYCAGAQASLFLLKRITLFNSGGDMVSRLIFVLCVFAGFCGVSPAFSSQPTLGPGPPDHG